MVDSCFAEGETVVDSGEMLLLVDHSGWDFFGKYRVSTTGNRPNEGPPGPQSTTDRPGLPRRGWASSRAAALELTSEFTGGVPIIMLKVGYYYAESGLFDRNNWAVQG